MFILIVLLKTIFHLRMHNETPLLELFMFNYAHYYFRQCSLTGADPAENLDRGIIQNLVDGGGKGPKEKFLKF